MDNYTQFLEELQFEISPYDDNYTEELLKVAQSFRTFGQAFDSFLVEHGYSEEIIDVKSKINFIKTQFQNNNIDFDKRTFDKCFINQKRIDRKTAFKISFAFGLNVNETNEFFKKICLERSFDCHNITELIYYYCTKHALSYGKALELIEQSPEKDLPNIQKSKINYKNDVLFTTSIIHEVDRFTSENELFNYLNENMNHFGYNNASATKFMQELWREISDTNGLIEKELEKIDNNKQLSLWENLLQILGLNEKDDNSKPLYEFKSEKDNRTIKGILKDNKLLHPIAEDAFPDRDGIQKAKSGNHISYDRMRKIIIFLSFYRFWADVITSSKEKVYCAKNIDTDRCLDEINRYLIDSGYPPLYVGNPYDWLFLFCSQTENPLEIFRDFMRELYTVHEESIM